MEPIRVKLDYPYDYQGELHEEMVISRRPRVSDQLAAGRAGKDAATQEIALLANLCGVVPEALHEMDMADYGKLQKVLQTILS